jgi:iron complex transport system ATP-binding protein
MLEIDGLSVTLGGATVLDGLSLDVEAGGWVALVGPNGAGKTTLLRAVAGLVEYEGTIRVDGEARDAGNRREAARRVAYVPQRPVLPPAMPVTDYVLLGRSAHHSYLGAPSRTDERVVAAVLDRLELGPFVRRRLGELSGGESQRAVLARALAQQAPVLLMDEPTSSLDLGHSQMVLELVDELRREQSLCVLAALHDLTLAAQYAQRLYALSFGRAIASGSPSEVLTTDLLEKVFGATVEILDGASGPSVTPVRPGQLRRGPVRAVSENERVVL